MFSDSDLESELEDPMPIRDPLPLGEPMAVGEPLAVVEPMPVLEPLAVVEPLAVGEPMPMAVRKPNAVKKRKAVKIDNDIVVIRQIRRYKSLKSMPEWKSFEEKAFEEAMRTYKDDEDKELEVEENMDDEITFVGEVFNRPPTEEEYNGKLINQNRRTFEKIIKHVADTTKRLNDKRIEEIRADTEARRAFFRDRERILKRKEEKKKEKKQKEKEQKEQEKKKKEQKEKEQKEKNGDKLGKIQTANNDSSNLLTPAPVDSST